MNRRSFIRSLAASSLVLPGALSDLLGAPAATTNALHVSTPDKNDPDLPRGVGRKYSYISFRFQPDGSTSLKSREMGYFITCHLLNDSGRATGGKPPPNFFTWMIDPVSGATKVLRPGVK